LDYAKILSALLLIYSKLKSKKVSVDADLPRKVVVVKSNGKKLFEVKIHDDELLNDIKLLLEALAH
jgi:hypothetical protein